MLCPCSEPPNKRTAVTPATTQLITWCTVRGFFLLHLYQFHIFWFYIVRQVGTRIYIDFRIIVLRENEYRILLTNVTFFWGWYPMDSVAGSRRGSGEVFMKITKKTQLPVFGFFWRGDNCALRGEDGSRREDSARGIIRLAVGCTIDVPKKQKRKSWIILSGGAGGLSESLPDWR